MSGYYVIRKSNKTLNKRDINFIIKFQKEM